jgi:hypothetical protein
VRAAAAMLLDMHGGFRTAHVALLSRSWSRARPARDGCSGAHRSTVDLDRHGVADDVRRFRNNELLIERNQLDAQPASASVALQRQRIESVIDDWSVMTDDERKQVIQLIFAEIRAEHTLRA